MQHSFHLHKHSIRVAVSHKGKQYKRVTGLTTDPANWDAGAKSLRARCKDRAVILDLMTIHSRLTEREITARTEEDVLAALDYALGVKERKQKPTPPPLPSFWEYFDSWGNRPSSSQRQRALAVRVVARLMGRKENWDEIDSAYWFKLQRKMEDEGYSQNYRWNIGTRLKCVMHEGYKLKYHRNEEFKEFRVKKEQTEAIALTPAEIELLWACKPQGELMRKVRDLALIGYYSAARFSDYSRLSLDNIRDGRLEFVQQKTGDKVLIPAAPRLVELLERNGGYAPDVNQIVFNRYVKQLAKDAGITGFVEIRGEIIPRWKAVQSHTFRRSAVTALYLSGVPIRDCMFVSGHKDIKAFQLYLKIGKEDAAERLAKAAFFK